MSHFSCEVCSFESFDSYDAIVWAIQNPWFRECSSLAGALEEPLNQEGSGSTDGASENGGDDDDDETSKNMDPITDLRGEVPIFCRVGNCLYWHTSHKQVRRHRNGHFTNRYGYSCPNQSDTCTHRGWSYRRRDAVTAHCRRSQACDIALRANGGVINRWGTPAQAGDLVPYNPNFHKPYQRFDGRTGGG